MADINIRYIMNQVKDAGNEKLKAMSDNNEPVCKATRKNKSGKTETDNIVFNEIPEFILTCIETAVKNIREEQGNKYESLEGKIEVMEGKLADMEVKVADMETKIVDKDIVIGDLRKTVREMQFEMDAHAQYSRSENFKIHGIPYTKGENTNDIVKKVVKNIGLPFDDKDISVSHRLMSKEQMDKQITPANRDKKVPAIIVRVINRDIKAKILTNRKNLALNPECPADIKGATMYEDVTPLRSRIMYALRHRNNKTAFKYVWSKGGRIYAQTHAQAAQDPQPPPLIVNTPDDLAKLGFSEQEIEDIIKKPQRQPQIQD